MTKTIDSEPWRGLPRGVADLVEPELEAATGEIFESIRRDVPEYSRPLEGNFGRGVRTGVGEALSQFVALIRDPDAGRELGREVYVALGRGESRQGRTLDSLQAAYRVGARVAWRRLARAGREAGLDAETLSLLAEAIFAYIDELSADSVEGYAGAQAESEDRRRRRREELVRLLLREPPADHATIRKAGESVGWKAPDSIAALACAVDDLEPLTRRLPPEVLVAHVDELGCVLVPDPVGPGQASSLSRAAGNCSMALGTAGPLGELPDSWRLARSALRAAAAGALPDDGLLRVEDHLAQLLLFDGSTLAARIEARTLSTFDQLTAKARARMEETALAYVHHRANAVEMAKALHLHPQTIRYRITRLRDLLGDDLDNPDTRFELEIALRARRPPLRNPSQRRRLRGSVRNTASQTGEETPNP